MYQTTTTAGGRQTIIILLLIKLRITVYYIEKQDITEEQIRLSSHLSYFIESMNQSGPIGKKLGFIAQEIGREINTIASKTDTIEISHLAVDMKDELEKIREQVQNIV